MANNRKFNVSRPQILAQAIDAGIFEGETLAAAEDWLAKLTAKRASGEPTKAQKEAAALRGNVIDAMRAYGQPVTARWVLENVPGVMTIQKASALLRRAVQNGEVIADVDKKRTEYTVA